VLQWREESRFCGSCGAANGDSPEELARLCPRCGRLEYPRISPAVITLVINDRGEALLAHNRKFSENVYSLIAGFVEAGESLEKAAAREIREEVNIGVKNLRFVTSQGWPFPNSLMVGFTARHAGGEIVCDGVEILDARWFSAESVRSGGVKLPHPGSVSLFIIKKWLAGEFG
jgi:NAD+ diphosphatase